VIESEILIRIPHLKEASLRIKEKFAKRKALRIIKNLEQFSIRIKRVEELIYKFIKEYREFLTAFFRFQKSRIILIDKLQTFNLVLRDLLSLASDALSGKDKKEEIESCLEWIKHSIEGIKYYLKESDEMYLIMKKEFFEYRDALSKLQKLSKDLPDSLKKAERDLKMITAYCREFKTIYKCVQDFRRVFFMHLLKAILLLRNSELKVEVFLKKYPRERKKLISLLKNFLKIRNSILTILRKKGNNLEKLNAELETSWRDLIEIERKLFLMLIGLSMDLRKANREITRALLRSRRRLGIYISRRIETIEKMALRLKEVEKMLFTMLKEQIPEVIEEELKPALEEYYLSYSESKKVLDKNLKFLRDVISLTLRSTKEKEFEKVYLGLLDLIRSIEGFRISESFLVFLRSVISLVNVFSKDLKEILGYEEYILRRKVKNLESKISVLKREMSKFEKGKVSEDVLYVLKVRPERREEVDLRDLEEKLKELKEELIEVNKKIVLLKKIKNEKEKGIKKSLIKFSSEIRKFLNPYHAYLKELEKRFSKILGFIYQRISGKISKEGYEKQIFSLLKVKIKFPEEIERIIHASVVNLKKDIIIELKSFRIGEEKELALSLKKKFIEWGKDVFSILNKMENDLIDVTKKISDIKRLSEKSS